MNYQDYGIENAKPSIPLNAFKPIKRCQYCQSVYMTDTHCEACGRSLLYHPIGEPFSGKSYYGMKERYCESLPFIVKQFTFFENTNSPEAQSFVRQISKRFDDLLVAFTEEGLIPNENRRFFYIETMEIIETLIFYGTDHLVLEKKLEHSLAENSPLLYQALSEQLVSLKIHLSMPISKETLSQKILNYRFNGLKIDFILKAVIISTTVVTVAISFYEVISLQVGK